MSVQGYIYKYTFPNGKVYIGQTRVSVKERHYQHMSASRDRKRSTISEIAIAKYGEPVLETIETIEVNDNEKTELDQLLNEAEKKWIKHYDSTNRAKGYNIQLGGKKVTPKKFILEEKWYEIYKKDKWGEFLGCIKLLLESIGTKFFSTHDKLTSDERKIFYGYKFFEYDPFGKKQNETTFNSFYKKYKDFSIYNDIGNLPYDVLETLEDEKAPAIERQKAKLIADQITYEIIMKDAFENLTKDVRETIWEQVNKQKDKILKAWGY